VCISGVNSSLSKVTCGVPQGSVLGPLLALVYINDIGNSVFGACVNLFAVDTNLFVFSNDVDLQIDASEKLILLSNWFIANILRYDKTCYRVFGATLSVLTAIFQVNLGKPVFIEAKDGGSGGD